jgi:hypothetical protein
MCLLSQCHHVLELSQFNPILVSLFRVHFAGFLLHLPRVVSALRRVLMMSVWEWVPVVQSNLPASERALLLALRVKCALTHNHHTCLAYKHISQLG